MTLSYVNRPAGAGDGLVHRLPGAHLLLLLGLPGGERVQQGLRHLRRRPVVGHGEKTHKYNADAHPSSYKRGQCTSLNIYSFLLTLMKLKTTKPIFRFNLKLIQF